LRFRGRTLNPGFGHTLHFDTQMIDTIAVVVQGHAQHGWHAGGQRRDILFEFDGVAVRTERRLRHASLAGWSVAGRLERRLRRQRSASRSSSAGI
jgi:hypothetical protein